jgi:thiol:disulfide interchange protein DsbA
MKNTIAVAALLLLSLSACAREPAPADSAASAPAAAAAAPATAAPATASGNINPVGSAQESADVDTQTDRSDAALERIAALPAAGTLPAGRWVAGTHYRPLVPAQPTNASPGKIEVVEIFWYGCPHCLALEPFIDSWQKNKPANVEFNRVPVMWGPAHRGHAQLFYTLQALGKLTALHTKVFDEIQRNGKALVAQGDDAATLRLQQAFARANGISDAEYAKAFSSFTVQTKLQQAEEMTRRYRVEGVPLIVINGKYVTDVGMAGGQSNLISLINDLAANEKRR